MKTILSASSVLVGLALAAAGMTTTAHADTAHHAREQKIVANIGASYDLLKSRHAALPTVDTARAEKTVVTDKQVDQKVKDRFDELEYCFLKLPAGRRFSTTAILHVSIDGDGTVSQAHMIGEVPVSVDKCMTQAAMRWRFAVTGNSCELEHSFTLNAN
jgi:hypothetical protein